MTDKIPERENAMPENANQDCISEFGLHQGTMNKGLNANNDGY